MKTLEKSEQAEILEGAPQPHRVVRYKVRRISYKVLMYALLIGLCSFIMLPVGWMFTAALKPDLEPVFTPTPEWFPSKFWEWDNFRRVLTESMPFLRYTINTMIIVIGNILGVLISCSIVGFAFARLRFRGSKVLFYILIVTMLIPWQALMVPQFLLFVKIGWYGTYLPLIVPSFTGSAFFIFLIRQYMRTIPKDLDDAARVDGLNTWQIFWRIILPLSTPVLTVCAVFTFLWSWNNLLGPLIYLDSGDKFTVALGLANLVTRADTPWNLTMAANLVTIIPTVIVYFFVQKKLIGGIASVGLKG
ncbi:MAG TPA: carbohydrate ABC transporter permease [Actinomycetota bacterium]|nr:carbohydrate ABC transporter permease [Actinomycetota bacterium]